MQNQKYQQPPTYPIFRVESNEEILLLTKVLFVVVSFLPFK